MQKLYSYSSKTFPPPHVLRWLQFSWSTFVSSTFLPLDLLYFKSVAILIHDISNSWKATNISNLFASQSNIYSFNTRSSSRGDYRYVKRHSRLDKQTKSFSRYGVRIWNSLPGGMPQMSKNNFKINVHNSLLRILSEENDYIDLPDLLVITEKFLENSASHISNIQDCKLNWIEFIYLYLFNMFYSVSLVLLVSYLYLVKSN